VATTSYPLIQRSSSGIFVRRLNHALSKSFDIETVCPDSSFPHSGGAYGLRYAPKRLQVLFHEPGGLPVAIKTKPFLLAFLPFFAVSLFAFSVIRFFRVDAVIAHWSLSGFVLGLVNSMFRKPMITVFHGSDANNIDKSKLNRLFAYVSIRFSSRVVGVSQAIVDDLADAFPRYSHKAVLIPNGVDEALLSVSPTKESFTVDVLTIANLNPLKGVGDLIEAFAQIEPDLGARLSIVGDGPERELLIDKAQNLGISNIVFFKGMVPPIQIEEQFARSAIFVLASYAEGRPSVILEAMASQTPVVASSLSGIIELITDNRNGLLFQPGDIQTLSQKIRSLIVDKAKRERLAASGRKTIIEARLTWRHTAEKYKTIFYDLGVVFD
jgi:glycosyltransferase involved in cell wall biosynthesis